jgi:DNA invertase Pin-like site-specific DNA recombinase
MRVKYNRTSTIQQDGNRFELDDNPYDLVLFDKGVSGSVPFNERPEGKRLMNLVRSGQVTTVVFEELSRTGRNTVDVLNTLEILEENEVNVVVRNLGIQSRPNGKPKNPVWKMIVSVMSSLYEMERENIRERTEMGRMVYLMKGGKLGRPKNSTESDHKFLNKPKSQEILNYLNKGKFSQREISKLCRVSPKTVKKVKDISSR